ncbi:hypothetical protein RRG08_027177 [Elysia crispata]|uniref:Uncharacterized protein n=1 Tax=Elysia crispata TaxID=231223 RepID=A0AAE0XZP5_9GAST|nr:hypothetical protein RRG08_027177 [Elysia crispata]
MKFQSRLRILQASPHRVDNVDRLARQIPGSASESLEEEAGEGSEKGDGEVPVQSKGVGFHLDLMYWNQECENNFPLLREGLRIQAQERCKTIKTLSFGRTTTKHAMFKVTEAGLLVYSRQANYFIFPRGTEFCLYHFSCPRVTPRSFTLALSKMSA